MAEDNEDRTEEATQTRRDEFRRRGEVAHTKELGSAFFLVTCAGLVAALSHFFYTQLLDLFHFNYGAELIHMIRSDDMFSAVRFAGIKMFVLIGPVLAVSGIVGVGSSILQTGFLQVEDALSPDLNKINPLSGLQRMLSIRSLVEGFKALVKMCLIGSVVYFLLKNEVYKMPRMMQLSTEELAGYIGMIVIKLFGGIGTALMILSGADYFYQRYDLEKRMKMTKQEIKDESKNREVDPQVKAKMRRMQREMSSKRMIQDIPKASVIITNPTHIAIALRYDDQVPAPQMVAKGADLIADKIKEIARLHNIPIVENKPLARTMYKTMKIGQVIPRELYVSVAEVLSYVMRLKRKMRGRI